MSVCSTTRQLAVSSPVYQVNRLSKEDEGTYACVARNAAGETEERVQIIVLEEDEYFPYPDEGGRYPDNSGGRYPDNSGVFPPDETGGSSFADNTPVTAGSNLRLDCLSVGDGAGLTGQWRRADGRRFPTRHYQQKGVLHLMDVDEDDEGTYLCQVVDNRGTVVYEIQKIITLICK